MQDPTLRKMCKAAGVSGGSAAMEDEALRAESSAQGQFFGEVLGGEAGRLTLYRLGGREDP